VTSLIALQPINMKSLHLRKAISPIVSYVLLIVISLALAASVFYTLNIIVHPTELPPCPTDTTLSIEKITCNVTRLELNLTLQNRGYFNITTAYVRISGSNLNKQDVNEKNPIIHPPMGPGEIRVIPYRLITINPAPISSREYQVEIQPAVFYKRKIIICPISISQPVTCTA
jgi:hypothetical protein